MRLKIKIALLTLMLLSTLMLTQSLVPVGAWTADDHVFDDFGPRVDNFVMNIYPDTELLMGALQAGEIDVADWEVPAEWKEDWSVPPYNDPSDPDYIKMMPVKSIGMRQFDLNHKEEIASQPGYTNPMTYQKFRQAVVHLTNKTEYVTSILQGEAVTLDTPIMPWTVWYETACDNYYPFDLDLARAALNAAGFTEIPGAGTVPGAPPGSDEWRQHPQTGSAMQPVILYIRADDLDRMAAGTDIGTKLRTVGIPTTVNVLPLSGCYTPVFVLQDYHIYTGGWDFSFDPDYLYDLYGGHAIPWPNYCCYDNASFNEASAGIKYATTFTEALTAAKQAQLIMTDDVCNIPLWTAVAQTAHRGYAEGDTNKPWEGFVNAEGVGVNNGVSYMNAHEGNETGGTLTCGQKEKPLKLNIMRSEWTYEYAILLRCYDFLLSADPYTFEDMAWLAHSWHVGTYYNTALGKECTILTFNLEDDIYWHDGEHFTSADVKFTLEYYHENQGWWWSNVMDVYEVQTPDDYTVVVLMSVKSFWALHWIGLGVPMMPKHIWEDITGDEIEATMPDPNLIGTSAFKYEGGDQPSGVPPQEYAVFSAYKPTSAGFFRHCPIKAAGGIDLQGDYLYPAEKNVMKRTVYAAKDIFGVLIHPGLNKIVPRIKCKNHHATTTPSWTGTWTLTETTGTSYSDSKTITVASQGPPVTMTFNTFDISGAASGELPYTFSAIHTADAVTGRTCSYTQDNLVKTLIGDIDGDGDCDLFDALELCVGFFLWYNGGIYYANADITGDGVVDVYDAVEMSYYMFWDP